ncbi:unnamed protein product [Prorocentrum cordatum]|uniref:Uncharacterized protein n=1 Tax=Prorocentrum cordatum TaxID=2364126 RepID=A0ABN9RE33_9DINO|nr:unnamed protein product [Polarella glacialis]
MFCQDCGKKSVECICSRSRSRGKDKEDPPAAPPAWWAGAESSLLEKQEERLKVMRDPIKKDVNVLKDDVTGINEAQKKLEERVGIIEGGQSSGPWQASFVEVMGLCKWEEKDTKGMTRKEASDLISELKAQLEPGLREHVREMHLRGPRNYSIKVPITPAFLQEIRGCWNEYLTNAGKVWNIADCVLYVRAERPPEIQAQYSKLGLVKDWAKANIDASIEQNVGWHPDFKVEVTSTGMESGILCEVHVGEHVSWHEDGLRICGLSEKAAKDGVKHFRRRGGNKKH